MAKPTLKPRWASTVTADPTRYVEPTPAKKDIGWDVGEDPPAQYANWLQGTTGQWIDWLDTYEDTAHTWTATQTFTPSTAVPGIVLGYNSATDTADETPSLAFKAGSSTRPVIDRLGAPSQRWLRREWGWWGTPSLSGGAADTDVLIPGEVGIWRRTSGLGPGPIYNTTSFDLADEDTGSSWAEGVRTVSQTSIFATWTSQYHSIYSNSLVRLAPSGTKSVICEFSARAQVLSSPEDAIAAIGLMQRGSAALPGLGGRELFVAPEAIFVATALTYNSRWQVFHRVGGVTTLTDTGILAFDALRRIRIEVVADTSLGGPRTNVYIDGVKVYSMTTINASGTAYAFSALHKPISNGASVITQLGPVRLLFGPI